MKANYIKEIFGTTDLILFAIWMGFALLGVWLSIVFNISNRDKHSKDTPVSFSWSFFLKDNAQRLVTTIMILFPVIRFAPQILGQEATTWLSLVIGLSIDRISVWLKSIVKGARK